jgi:hypothetical protein
MLFGQAKERSMGRSDQTGGGIHRKLRLAKGLVLALWIFFLLVFALLAATGNFTSLVAESAKRLCSKSEPPSERAAQTRVESDPSATLDEYMRSVADQPPPPIVAVLDLLVQDPSWTERAKKLSDAGRDEQCRQLFRSVHDRLKVIHPRSQSEKDKGAEVGFFVPEAFRPKDGGMIRQVSLPPEADSWIEEYWSLKEAEKKRAALIDQFVLLNVLGAFGSLIFLTEKYIKGREPGLAAFAFRPVLGMFLAFAMFVLHMASHALVSNAHYLEMRPETLYLLAFSGGLMSEQVYALVVKRLESTIQRVEDSEPGTENAAEGLQTEDTKRADAHKQEKDRG